MTAKRDLKRRVRQRQARTGEAYVTARRHVVTAKADGDADADDTAQTPGAAAPGKPAGAAMSVVELLDVSEQARRLGLVCRVAMFPALAARVETESVLARLRDLLVETADDPQFRLLAQLALTGHAPPRPLRPPLQSFETVHRFFRRAHAGIGGVSADGTTLAFHVAGRDGLVPVGCALHWPGSLVLSGIDELMSEVAGLRDWLTTEGRAGAHQVADLLAMRIAPIAVRDAPKPFAPTLFVVHDGRRYEINQDEFLIGRSRGTVHLTIRDGMVSRRHAAVIRRHGVHYIKDLGSVHGITYKGMRIDNKRIDEGDVFQIGDYELRFTYRGEDEK